MIKSVTMIVISYGKNATKTTYDALSSSDIDKYLKPTYKVALKPNLVVPGPASSGAVTHPEVTEGVILYLRDFGVSRITIIESSWTGADTADAFKDCGYEELSRKYGIPLLDLKKDRTATLDAPVYSSQSSRGACIDAMQSSNKSMRQSGITICKAALETDFLLNLPVLKAHCQTWLTCCLKNLKGCIPDAEKRRFHTLGIHKPVADLNALIKTGYCVVDGICGDLSFEEGGNPVFANRVIAGRDPVTVDSYCASLIGYRPDEIEYLMFAEEIGVGKLYSPEVPLVQIGIPPLQTDLTVGNAPLSVQQNKYKHLIDERDACSPCYSALIYALHRMGGKTNAPGKFRIGQGFKGERGKGIGIGSCASGFDICVKGCPPTATDIMEGVSPP